MTKVSFMNIMFFLMIRTEQGRWVHVHKQNYIKQTKHAYMANKEAACCIWFSFFVFSSDDIMCVRPFLVCVFSCVSCPRQLIILSLAPDDIGIVDDYK